MLSFLMLTLSSAWASCPVSFDFIGQPACTEITYEAGRIAVGNRCEHALLVDQSLLLHTAEGPPSGLILPGTTAQVRDLSVFTLGMSGQLYQVAAVVVAEEGCGDTGQR